MVSKINLSRRTKSQLVDEIVELRAQLAALKSEFGPEINHDVAKRDLAEDALQFSKFSLDHAGDAVSWIGESGKLEYANKSLQRMFGYSRNELLAPISGS